MANGMRVTQEEITYGMLTHLAALALIVFPLFGNILGPLIVWLVKKDQSAWVDMHGKAALNFQISITIYFIVVGFLSIILTGILSLLASIVGLGIFMALSTIVSLVPVLLFAALGIFFLVMLIVASIKANNGEYFKYYLSIPIFK